MIDRSKRPTTYLNRWRAHSLRGGSSRSPIHDQFFYWQNCATDASIMVFVVKAGSKLQDEWRAVTTACEANAVGWASR
jgi:hypothetical protein